MTAGADPTDLRLALMRALTQARESSGLTLHQVAAEMGWTLSELLLVEAVEEGVNDGRLDALVDRYRLADVTGLDAVRALPRRAITLSSELRILLAYETAASAIDSFEPFVIPGLLQTQAYATVALSFYAAGADLEAHVQARLARQGLLSRAGKPQMRFLIDESVLHRWSGATGDGAVIMREQLAHLRAAARLPRVRIQVVPLGAGLHEGMKGAFVTLQLDGAEPGRLVYLEDAKGDTVRIGTPQAAPYDGRFQRLAALAAPALELDAFLDRALARLNGGAAS